MPTFRLGRTVRDNIKALRSALGSATRELSRDDLALLINRETNRGLTGSTIRWWEQGTGEPDIQTIAVMARLAGVTFEQFALGTGEAADQLEIPDPMKDRKLTLEEGRRAVQKAEREKSEQAQRARGIANGSRKRRK